jgi:hypothetical protein
MHTIQSPFRSESSRKPSRTQRPVHRREFLPVGVLALIRILTRRSNNEERPLIFGPEVKG